MPGAWPDVLRLTTAACLSGVLACAAYNDVKARRIPNWTVLAAFALFIPWAAADPAYLGSSILAFGIAATTAICLYAFGIVGAGDTKLFAVLALFAGMRGLETYVLATALSGGLIGAVMLATRPTKVAIALQTRGAAPAGVQAPYGVAIALGAGVVLWTQLHLAK